MARYIYAPNVHSGGGYILLYPLINQSHDKENVIYVLDSRIKNRISQAAADKTIWVEPNLISRLLCEIKLFITSGKTDSYLCMGNLPPLLSRSQNISVFLQNKYLLVNRIEHRLPLRSIVRILVERIWLKYRASSVSKFITQTASMHEMVKHRLDRDSDIAPFYDKGVLRKRSSNNRYNYKYDYIYPASGEKHKNHIMLINAWIILSKRGVYPSLCLTLDEMSSPDIYAHVKNQAEKYALNISMIGQVDHSSLLKLYDISRALIFPSLFESFGLPLIEAAMIEMPIIASDMDYVMDVVKPSDTFDPESDQSIADTIQRQTTQTTTLAANIISPSMFLDKYI